MVRRAQMGFFSILVLTAGFGFAFFVFTLLRSATTFGMCPHCRSQVPALEMVYVGAVNRKLCHRCAERVLRKRFNLKSLAGDKNVSPTAK
jgi:hypothetical protein